MLPSYIITRASITDPEQYRKYLEATPSIIKNTAGKRLPGHRLR